MTPPPDHTTLQHAANWYARLNAAPEDTAVHKAWRHWHAEDEAHRQAWNYVERIRQRFEPLQNDAETTLLTLRGARVNRPTRRQILLGLGALSATTLLGLAGWRSSVVPQTLAAWRADYRSGVGEVREVVLTDGSQVWLNSVSILDVDFSPQQRVLQLRSGEILVDTGDDPRPFLVTTRHGRMRALGTRFSVTQQHDHTRLAVFEGAVEVCRGAGNTCPVVQAGQQLGFDKDQTGALTPANQSRQAWTRGLLVADDLSLEAFVVELARYRHGHLGVDPTIADIRVMGTYPLDDIERTLAMLESALPVRVERTFPWWANLVPR